MLIRIIISNYFDSLFAKMDSYFEEVFFTLLMAFTTRKMGLMELINILQWRFLPTIGVLGHLTLLEKAKEYETACESITTLLDRCFPRASPWWFPKDIAWNHFNGLRIRLRHDESGHWCFYIAVPRHHVLFGAHYDELESNATYSKFMAGDKLWWEFGWDYNSPRFFIPLNLLHDIRRGCPDAFMNADVLKPEYLESEIRRCLDLLLRFHKTKTGVDFEAFPGSSWSNRRHRKIKAARSKKAEETSSHRFF
jgi:hypothetical protein